MPPRKGTPWSEARRAACTPEYLRHLHDVNVGREPWNKGLDMETLLPKRRKRRPRRGSFAQEQRSGRGE